LKIGKQIELQIFY